MYIRKPTTIGTTASAEIDSISRDAGNSRNFRNRRDGSMSRDATTVRADAPKISNSKEYQQLREQHQHVVGATAGTLKQQELQGRQQHQKHRHQLG